MPGKTRPSPQRPRAQRGDVLSVLRGLLNEGRSDDVLAVVAQLVARNDELERRLAQVLARGRKNEGSAPGQLLLFIDKLEYEAGADEDGGVPPEIAEANKKLREASGIDAAAKDDVNKAPPRKRQPSLRAPAP